MMAPPKACHFCNKPILRNVNLALHEDNCDQNPSRKEKSRNSAVLQTGGGNHDGFHLSASALQGAVREYHLTFGSDQAVGWMFALRETITKDANFLLDKIRDEDGTLFKWYLTLKITFRKAVNPEIVTDPAVYFHSHPVLLYVGDLESNLQEAMEALLKKINSYEQEGSGWVVDSLVTLIVNVVTASNPLSRKQRDKDDSVDNPSNVMPIQGI